MTVDTSIEQLVTELRDRGIELWIDGGLLRFSASKVALTPPLMLQMRKNKAAILEWLASESPDHGFDRRSGPVSFGQEALWLLHRQHPESAAYNTAAAMRFLSDVDIAALRSALQKLVARHEPLRTTFEATGQGVEAIVHTSEMLDFQQIQLTHIASEIERDKIIRSEYERPFDLETGPLMRARLFTNADDDHVLLIAVHHIVFDAWSLWVMHDELKQLYVSEVEQTDCLMAALPTTFSDFVRWQRALPESTAGAKQWSYWQRQLAGDPVPAELMWDAPRPRHRGVDGATHHFEIQSDLAEGLRALGRRHSATPMATGLAVFETLMFRHTHVDDFVVGITTSGRPQAEYSKAIGYFVNTLPIRCKTSGERSFIEMLDQTKRVLSEARENQDFPFAELVRRLNPVRDPNAPPLCRVVFGLQRPMAGQDVSALLSGEDSVVDWGGLRVAPYKMEQQEGQFDLVLELYERDHGYAGVLKYDRNLLSDASAARFSRRFVKLLQGIVADPSRKIDEYDIIDLDERSLLADWSSGPELHDPRHLRMDQWFAEQAASTPDSECLVLGETRWTYSEVDAAVNRIARLLAQQGIEQGRVIVACGRRVESPLLMLACFRLGVAYVPVSAMTPLMRLRQIIHDFPSKAVIAESGLLEAIQSDLDDRIPTHWLEVETLLQQAASLDSSPLPGVFSHDRTAYIICTSGSTGKPKGIVVSHAALCRHVHSIREVFRTDASDRVYQFSDLTFDPSIEQMLVPWTVGGAVVFRGESLPGVQAFWQQMNDEQITVANLPPAYFEECCRVMPLGNQWPQTLRLMIVGGDVFPPDVIADWNDRGVRLLNAYGPTESVITATTSEVTPACVGRRVPIGRPKPGSTAVVVDAAGQLTPVGVAGELCLGGPMLADGYFDLPDLTEKQFVEMPLMFRDNTPTPIRVYRSGDLARWSDRGELEFLGRIDRQVKIRGFRIELGDIESSLSKHPEVTGAIVKSIPHDAGSFLAAFVTSTDGSDLSSKALVSMLKSQLPNYMVPQRVVVLEKFPLLPSGKVDTNQLTAKPPTAEDRQRDYHPPRNDVEQVMADVWGEVLGIEQVGIFDDFYQLGGGSLQSLRIVSELTARGLQLSRDDEMTKLGPELLFQYTTISELSPHLRIRE